MSNNKLVKLLHLVGWIIWIIWWCMDLQTSNLLILFRIRRNCLSSGRSQLLHILIRAVIKQRHIILSNIYIILSNILLPKLMPYAEVGNNSVDFNVTGQLLFIYSAFVKYLRKNGNKSRQYFSFISTEIKPMIQIGGRSCIIFSLSLVSLWT
jgi:hypothetical protein